MYTKKDNDKVSGLQGMLSRRLFGKKVKDSKAHEKAESNKKEAKEEK